MKTEFDPGYLKDKSSVLNAFNNMILTMKERATVRIVLLHGDDESVNFVVNAERSVLSESGYRVCFLPKIDANTDIRPNFVYFTKALANNITHFDVDATFANEFLVPKWESAFIKMLGLTTTASELEAMPCYKQLEEYCENNMSDAVTKTLTCHFGSKTDVILHEDDLRWLSDLSTLTATERSESAPAEAETKNEPEVKTESDQAANTANAAPVQTSDQEQTAYTKDVAEEQSIASPVPGTTSAADNEYRSSREQNVASLKTLTPFNTRASEQKAPEQADERTAASAPTQEETDLSNEPPKPNVVSEKKREFEVKESLTKEDRQANEAIMNELRAACEETIDVLEESYSALYRPIIKKIKECMASSKFDVQFSRMYMENSNDYSTKEYAMIYMLDEKIKNSYNKVIHKIQHMGCPGCGVEWDEDLTFLSKGIHEITCPKCGMPRQIDITD